MKLLPILLTFLFSFIAKADDFLLSKLINGVDGTESAVILEAQDDKAVNIVFSDYVTRLSFSFDELSQKELPIITYNEQEVMLMECVSECRSSTGGVFIIRYLYNGMFGTYNTLHIWLKKIGNAWILSDIRNNTIRSIKISPRYMAGNVIGISININ